MSNVIIGSIAILTGDTRSAIKIGVEADPEVQPRGDAADPEAALDREIHHAAILRTGELLKGAAITIADAMITGRIDQADLPNDEATDILAIRTNVDGVRVLAKVGLQPARRARMQARFPTAAPP